MATRIWSRALKAAADKVWHTSNIFTIPEQERLGQRLVDATFADAVFFTNSGTEAVECAIKTARHYFWAKGEPDRYEIIAFTGSFHGRTLGTIAAGGNPHYLEGFGPPLAGFKHTAPGDLDAVEALIGAARPAPSSSSRCRARAASPPCRSSSCAACARSATSTACC